MTASPLQHFLRWENQCPNDIFLRQPVRREWMTYSWQQAGEEGRKLVEFLRKKGVNPGDRVAILSKNCAHWIMADIALMMGGYVSVPIYPTLTAGSIETILTHSESKAVICGKLDDHAGQRKGIPSHIIHVGVDFYQTKGDHSWEQIMQEQSPSEYMHTWKKEDLFTIMYTSGTTGKPKGVMHRAGSFDKVIDVAVSELKLPARPALFSYLPLSHIAEKVGIEYNGLYNGACFSFAETLDSFAQDLESVQPQCFFAVPRIWSKFREGILKKFSVKKLNTLLSIPLLGNFIRKKIKTKLGLGRATHIFSGAAPLPAETIAWFETLGIRIYQAYGMTEDCVYAHFEREGIRRIGSVGKPLKGLKTKITAEGELLVKSDCLMMGYYKESELTAEVMDEEGYFKTGDKVAYDHDGFLFITGRVKDQFKTDKGKYISPGPIEMELLNHEIIEQVCVVGMGIPQPLVLITLNEIGTNKTKEEIDQMLTAALDQINRTLEHHEKLEKAVVMKESWTVENGLLTPTMKVKRNEIEKIHQGFYPDWFHQKERVVWEKH